MLFRSVITGATACILAVVSALGFQPVLDRCVAGHDLDALGEVFFDPTQGGLVCANHSLGRGHQNIRLSLAEKDVLQRIMISQSWHDLRTVQLSDAIHQAVWALASRAFDRPLPRWWRLAL